MKTSSVAFLLGLWLVATTTASPARADPLGLTGSPARVFFETQGAPHSRRIRPDVEGRFVERNGNVFVFARSGTSDLAEVPLDTIARLDVSRGKSGHGVLGGLLGFGVGALVGASRPVDDPHTSAADVLEPASYYNEFGAAYSRVENAMVGGFIGLFIGASVGLLLRSEQWEEVSTEELRLGLVPGFGARDGRISLELRFAYR